MQPDTAEKGGQVCTDYDTRGELRRRELNAESRDWHISSPPHPRFGSFGVRRPLSQTTKCGLKVGRHAGA